MVLTSDCGRRAKLYGRLGTVLKRAKPSHDDIFRAYWVKMEDGKRERVLVYEDEMVV
jgi:hypothetical protein